MSLHIILLISFLALCTLCTCERSYQGRIVIAGLFPLSDDVPEGAIGRGVKPAVNLALEMINNDDRLLSEYKLDIVPSDTKCDMAVATKFFFDMVDSNSTMVMVFGDACSSVSGPIAEISKEWNVWLLSYADMDPALSDRKKYHNFYRTVPSDNDFNPARLALLRKFNWTNVATIFQGVSKGTARYGHAHNHLVPLLEKADINVIKSVGFVKDPEPAIKELKDTDARIIIGNFDESMARQVFCYAYENKMYGPKHQWIILGGYSDNWWKIEDPKVSCTIEQINETIYGYISTDILPLSSSKKPTESGMSPLKYFKMYNEKSEGQYSKYHGYAFDGVYVIAKVVDKILKKAAEEQNTTKPVMSATMFRGDKISGALNDTDFRGVTGQVKFQQGDRIGSILFEQFQGDGMIKIAEYHKIKDKLTYKNSFPVVWKGGGPPIDRKLVRVEYQRVPTGIYISICSVSGLGIIMSVFFLVTNIVFREHRYIKMSSPNLNNIIIIGCVLTYLSVFLLGTDAGVIQILYLGHICTVSSVLTYLSVFLLGTDAGVIQILYLRHICTSRAWVMSIGFTLAFGAMFSKTWRVHSIFKDIKLHKKVIKDYKLILVVTILLFLDAGILVTWQILDPLRTAEKNLTTLIEGDLDVVPVIEYCRSQNMTIWLAIIYAYKGLLLVFGCFLAWETRQVSIPALNDSKYIGMSVYNVVIMCVCGAAVSVVINDQPTSSFVIISFFIIFCTTITLCLVFVPKIIELRRDPTGEERRIRAKLQKPRKQGSRDDSTFDLQKKNKDLQDENIRFRNIISEKLRILHDLLDQLGEDTHEIYFAGKSPLHKKVLELRLADASPGKFSTASDDLSLNSEVSFTSSWALGSNTTSKYKPNKSVTSACTDLSVIESTEDVSCNQVIHKPNIAPTKKPNIEDDEIDEDDVFGGVYCGPPEHRKSLTNTPWKENGRSSSITEVRPLVHDFPNRSYNTTESDFSMPVLSTVKVGAADMDSNISKEVFPTMESKKSSFLGNRRKVRKITFMFPNQNTHLNHIRSTDSLKVCPGNGEDRGMQDVHVTTSENVRSGVCTISGNMQRNVTTNETTVTHLPNSKETLKGEFKNINRSGGDNIPSMEINRFAESNKMENSETTTIADEHQVKHTTAECMIQHVISDPLDAESETNSEAGLDAIDLICLSNTDIFRSSSESSSLLIDAITNKDSYSKNLLPNLKSSVTDKHHSENNIKCFSKCEHYSNVACVHNQIANSEPKREMTAVKIIKDAGLNVCCDIIEHI